MNPVRNIQNFINNKILSKTPMASKSTSTPQSPVDKKSDQPATPRAEPTPVSDSQAPQPDLKTPVKSEANPQPSTGKLDIDGDIEDRTSQLPPAPTSRVPNPMFKACTPPEAPDYGKFPIFLAGSIEMGRAIQWQRHMYKFLDHLPITVCNPRRGAWDPNVVGAAKDAAFRHQVEWELDALHEAKVICFFFDVTTQSPVTMLELGLWAHSGKIVVCCGDTFWKAGNVHIVCERYGIPFTKDFKELPGMIEKMLTEKGMKVDENGALID